MRPLIRSLVLVLSACTVDTAAVHQPIIGGETATPAEFPTVVALEQAPGDWYCTGTLIHPDWVLTAAHCVEGETPAQLKIRFDDADLADTAGGTVVAVAEIHAHADWSDPVWDNDIALIKLARSVTDREPTPIHRTAVPAETTITEVGYGDSDNDGGGAGILRKLVVPTIDCDSADDPALSGVNLLCLDPTSGRASCDGDSGGPAFVTIDGKRVTAGINSGVTGDDCTSGVELYTAVAGELDFVDAVIGVEEPGPSGDGEVMDAATTGGGCSTGGSARSWLLVALALVLTGRRRVAIALQSR